MKRRIRPRTDIPDWRDPDMPVIRDYTMRDGSKKTIVDQDYEHRYREFMVSDPNGRYPNWCNDPTYNIRKSNESRKLPAPSGPGQTEIDSLFDQLSRIQTKSR